MTGSLSHRIIFTSEAPQRPKENRIKQQSLRQKVGGSKVIYLIDLYASAYSSIEGHEQINVRSP